MSKNSKNETPKKRREEKRQEEIRRDKINTISMKPEISGSCSDEWKDTLWLKTFLEKQTYISKGYIPYLIKYKWWDDVSISVNGLNLEFIEKEFAKMGAWFMENYTRRPTFKGIKRFVRDWLERAYEKERK